jgi:hypothetical protein|tara:strand:- start:2430 stop:2609 length:180 start_codon:yes stop_codon:yes gene_type:complete
MSINLELTVDDYKNIINWFEIAFAKNSSQKPTDDTTFKKVTVMCMAKLEEMKEDEEQKE